MDNFEVIFTQDVYSKEGSSTGCSISKMAQLM